MQSWRPPPRSDPPWRVAVARIITQHAADHFTIELQVVSFIATRAGLLDWAQMRDPDLQGQRRRVPFALFSNFPPGRCTKDVGLTSVRGKIQRHGG